jgi:hypothetical protein
LWAILYAPLLITNKWNWKMNNDDIRREREAARQGIKPRIINEIPMRTPPEERLPGTIRTDKDQNKWATPDIPISVLPATHRLNEFPVDLKRDKIPLPLSTKGFRLAEARHVPLTPFANVPASLAIAAVNNMPLTKAFDYIRASGGRAFLAHCTCEGDVCNCSHDGHTFHASNNKDSSEMSILEKLSAAGITLDDLKKVAPSLSPADRTALIAALNAEAAKSPRMERMLAAAEYQRDRKVQLVTGELGRLGPKPSNGINAAAQKYRVSELDQAMKAKGWTTNRRMALKADMSILGLLDWSSSAANEWRSMNGDRFEEAGRQCTVSGPPPWCSRSCSVQTRGAILVAIASAPFSKKSASILEAALIGTAFSEIVAVSNRHDGCPFSELSWRRADDSAARRFNPQG